MFNSTLSFTSVGYLPSHAPDCDFPDNFADLEWRQEDVGLYEVKHTFFSMQFFERVEAHGFFQASKKKKREACLVFSHGLTWAQ